MPPAPFNNPNPASLLTRRLRLRQWRHADLPAFAALNQDPAVSAWTGFDADRAASDAMAGRIADEIDRRGWGFWALEIVGGAPFIGFAGLHVPECPIPGAVNRVEIGWRLAPAFWGHGFATEAASAALRFGFIDLGLPEIVAFTAVGNQRSRAVMHRLGMVADEATFRHPALPHAHPLSVHVLYRIRAQDVPARRLDQA